MYISLVLRPLADFLRSSVFSEDLICTMASITTKAIHEFPTEGMQGLYVSWKGHKLTSRSLVD